MERLGKHFETMPGVFRLSEDVRDGCVGRKQNDPAIGLDDRDGPGRLDPFMAPMMKSVITTSMDV
jgi:hypothetical protein